MDRYYSKRLICQILFNAYKKKKKKLQEIHIPKGYNPEIKSIQNINQIID